MKKYGISVPNCVVIGLLATLTLCAVVRAQPASFQGMGGGEPYWIPTPAISADGTTVVVGYFNRSSDLYWGFRWTAATGAVGFDDPGFGPASVSADGSVVVGTLPVQGTHHEAARWTATTGVVPQGLPGGHWAGFSQAGGVSADGQIAVGNASGYHEPCGFAPNLEVQAFHQDSPGGSLHTLTPLPGYGGGSASAITADGSTIVGVSLDWECQEPFASAQACLWRIGPGSGQPIPLGFTEPFAVSADGGVVVGQSRSGQYRAIRWTAAEGAADLGNLPGYEGNNSALALSADGEVVVGFSGNNPPAAFIWDPAHGMRDFRTVLVDLGLNMTGWTLYGAFGISADGRTIVGNGENPAGQNEAWIAFLGDPLPTPCVGDVNGDQAVDLGDLATLLAHFGASSGALLTDGDLDDDGDVDLTDLTLLLANFGTTCP